MRGKWCPYRECLLCQEESDCLNCKVYYESMPVPYDGRTLEQIDQDNSRLFGSPSSLPIDNGYQMV